MTGLTLTKIAMSDQPSEFRDRALARIKWLKQTSDSDDIKAWDVSGIQDQLDRLPDQGPPPSQAPPLTIPLPAEVTGLRRVGFIESDVSNVIFSAQSHSSADGNLEDVTIRIPGFTFKAARASGREGWVYLLDRFEIEHNGRSYYASGSMLIRTIPGGMVSDLHDTSIECWFSSNGAIYKNARRRGSQVSFSDLLSD